MNHPTFFDRLRAWFVVLPLLLLVGVTYWLNAQVRPLSFNVGKMRHDPDVIVSNFSATALNEQGTPHYILSARKMTHFPDDDSTHLEDLRLKSLAPNEPPVYTSAKEGEVSSKGDEVFLRGDVTLVRAASDRQSEMTFATDYLHAVPDRDLIDTTAPVTMTDAYNVVKAVGMKFDNKTRVVKLLAEVRSQHEPAKH